MEVDATGNKTTTNDLFGIFFVRKPGWKRWDSYYKTIYALKPLFMDEKSKKVVTGYYLNICGDFDSVRISYFVDGTRGQESISLIKNYLIDNWLLEVEDHSSPYQDLIAEKYGSEAYEKRFRNFLVNETQVGLELIERDLLHARGLFARAKSVLC